MTKPSRFKGMNVHEIGSLNLDVFAIADHFGGRKPLYDVLVQIGGHDYLLRTTMDKWFDRRRIPLHWLLTIIDVSRELEMPLDPYAFTIPPEYERIEDCPPRERELHIRKYGRTLGIPLDEEQEA